MVNAVTSLRTCFIIISLVIGICTTITRPPKTEYVNKNNYSLRLHDEDNLIPNTVPIMDILLFNEFIKSDMTENNYRDYTVVNYFDRDVNNTKQSYVHVIFDDTIYKCLMLNNSDKSVTCIFEYECNSTKDKNTTV